MPGQRVEQRQALDLVVRERDAQRGLGVLGGEHVQNVTPYAEGAAFEFELVSFVLHRREARDHVALGHPLLFAHVQNHAVVVDGVADTVDA